MILIGSLRLLVKLLLTRFIPLLMNAISTFGGRLPSIQEFCLRLNNSILCTYVDRDEVAQLVRSMPANKTPGIFPRSWKLAVV